jgi:acetylornithine deacetylase
VNVCELTRRLIDIPSVTGSEKEVGSFLANYLESLDYQVEAQKVAEGRANIIATTNAVPRVVLSSHMDTVPPHIPASEDEIYIYGRGSCDAKGIIAAQIAAAEQLRSAGLTKIGLLFTVDEEQGSAGARIANTHPAAAGCQYLINGEPTENKLGSGTKGSLRLILRTQGRAAHSAYPEEGESAIYKLLDALEAVRACHWPVDQFFGETTCNIGTISGGAASNIVPAEAEAAVMIRLSTVAEHVKQILERAVADHARVEYLSEHGPLRLSTVEGFEQKLVRFTTDIPYLTSWGEPFLLGPGSVLDAHTSHERVSKQQLTEAVELYARLIQTLVGRDSPSA